MIRQNHRGLLTALSLLMVGSDNIFSKGPDARAQAQPHGHKSSQGSTYKNTGPAAKKAEKARRRLTRRASR